MRVFDFMRYKHIWFGISALVIGIGLVFLLINGGLNYGIDYTGGSSIQINFDKQFDIEQVRELMAKYDPNAIVTYAGNENQMAMVKTNIGFDVEKQGQIKDVIKSTLGVDQSNVQIEYIGPAIGSELKIKALIAVVLANVGILIYVALRFEWKLGLSAIIALVHDVLVMITVYTVLQIPLSSAFLAALLTIIGYSINDTIVIFDRIRENMGLHKKMSEDDLVNLSTSQCLTRTINTSATTLVTVLALYILGVPAIKDFALPMLVGIISGVYSTVFIASPMWVILRRKFKPAVGR
jgi:preprotein translocase subunit SecF